MAASQKTLSWASFTNMNVCHNIYPTFHVHWDKSCWCNKNSTTFTICINLNSVFTDLYRHAASSDATVRDLGLYKISSSKLENTWLTLAEIQMLEWDWTPTGAWQVPGHMNCHSQTHCFTEPQNELGWRRLQDHWVLIPCSTRPWH